MVTKDQILKALSVIEDPDFRKDIVSLGFVKNIKIDGSAVSLDIELTTPACPVKNEFKKAAEQVLLGLEGVKKAVVGMTSRPTVSNQPKESGLVQVKNIIAVASCKGGVGKSTVAANLALELSTRGFKIGLLDTDIFGPSVPTLFHLHNPEMSQQMNGFLNPVVYKGLKMMSFGFLFPEGPMILRGPMVSNYIQQILHNVNWGELDYLILDMPPGTGDIQLTITQAVKLTGAVIVTTRQSLSLVDVARGIEMFEKVNVPMLGIVENMAYFVCDNCDKKHHIFGGDKGTVLSERFGLETLAELPIERVITEGLPNYKTSPAISVMVDKTVMALGKHSIEEGPLPQVTHNDTHVIIEWADGRKTKAAHRSLRTACQCASCIDEFSGEEILDKNSISHEIKPLEIMPLGRYAVSIHWSDGHNSGIYSWKLLEKVTA